MHLALILPAVVSVIFAIPIDDGAQKEVILPPRPVGVIYLIQLLTKPQIDNEIPSSTAASPGLLLAFNPSDTAETENLNNLQEVDDQKTENLTDREKRSPGYCGSCGGGGGGHHGGGYRPSGGHGGGFGGGGSGSWSQSSASSSSGSWGGGL